MGLRISAIVLVLVSFSAVACGGRSDQPTATDGPTSQSSPGVETSEDAAGVCTLLPKEQVEKALGTADLTAVTDLEYECAYGVEGEEAQVKFHSGTLAVSYDDPAAPSVEISNDQLYAACEELLAAAAPML